MIKQLLEKVTKMMAPHPVYAVGGCVRDYILGVEPKDYDFCTPADPEEIQALIKKDGRRAYLTGKRFGTLGCKVDGHLIEITTFRTETYERNNRKPEVSYVKSIHEDLSRRDFTINAICMRLCKGHIRIIDPFNGTEDIEKGIIRCVGSPKQRLKEDPLRMLRAIRFACRFDFVIHPDTKKKMQSGAIQILNISKERQMDELNKILQTENVEKGLLLLWQINLFNYIIPEMGLQYNFNQNSQYHNFKLHEHTIKVVKSIGKDTNDLNILWSGLLHDSMKPLCKTENKNGYSNYINHEILAGELVDRYAKYLNWSKERYKKVRELVVNHLNDDSPLRKYDNLGK